MEGEREREKKDLGEGGNGIELKKIEKVKRSGN